MALDWERINSILGSKSFENVAGLTGAFIQGKGQADRADRQLAQDDARLGQNAAQFAATLAQRQMEGKRSNDIQAALAMLQGTKLGENENFVAKNRTLSSVLPNLRNSNYGPTDPSIRATMGPQGGFLPQNGLPPSVLQSLSDAATASAIANRSRSLLNIDPRAAMPDFAGMGLDADGAHASSLEDYRSGVEAAAQEDDDKLEELLQRALLSDYSTTSQNPAQKEEEKKGGFLSKLGGILKIAAPIGAALIPGVGPLAAAAIAGGGSAVGSKLQGNSWGDSAISGLYGGAAGYGAKKVPQKSSWPGSPYR